MDRKYIVLKSLQPILFSATMTHGEVAVAFGGKDRVRSAGFWSTDGKKYFCHGRSSSLEINSDPIQDSMILTNHFGDSWL